MGTRTGHGDRPLLHRSDRRLGAGADVPRRARACGPVKSVVQGGVAELRRHDRHPGLVPQQRRQLSRHNQGQNDVSSRADMTGQAQ